MLLTLLLGWQLPAAGQSNNQEPTYVVAGPNGPCPDDHAVDSVRDKLAGRTARRDAGESRAQEYQPGYP